MSASPIPVQLFPEGVSTESNPLAPRQGGHCPGHRVPGCSPTGMEPSPLHLELSLAFLEHAPGIQNPGSVGLSVELRHGADALSPSREPYPGWDQDLSCRQRFN